MSTAPVRMRRATARARSGSADQTPPARPYRESLAIATASSSSANGMIDEHRAEDLLLGDGGAGVDVGEHGGGDEVAAVRQRGVRPAGDQPGAVA